jgi:PIN domain nuclease of toxin-antitoxin system
VKLLLDTHIWLWSVLEPDRLSRRVANELSRNENELWFSPISVWELTFLHRKGKMKMPEDIPKWVAATMEDLKLIEAPVTVDVALAVSALKFSHGDPADHFLAATSKVFSLTLVTADQNLIALREIHTLANR